MATIRFADGWVDNLMDAVLNGSATPDGFRYHAYVNDLTPSPTTILGDFTECTTTGYLPELIDNSGWSFSNPGTGQTVATNGVFVWELEDAVTVYGYYVTNGDSTTLFWSQRFDSPVVFGALGGSITLQPTVQFNTPIV